MSAERRIVIGEVFGREVGDNFPKAAVVSVANEGDAVEKVLGGFWRRRDSRNEGKAVDILETVGKLKEGRWNWLTIFLVHSATPSSDSIIFSYSVTGGFSAIELSQCLNRGE